jgi:hypothetical protein
VWPSIDRSAPSKVAKTKPQVPHNSHPKESGGGASESEVRRLDREIVKLASRRAALTVKSIQGQASPQKMLFSPVCDEHLKELLEKGNPGPLTEAALRGMFREMISGARSVVKVLRIVDLGPAAVPELIEELEVTEDPWILQLLGFALRAIDDRRSVPALIRAIPRTMPSTEPEKRSFTLAEWQMYRHPPETIMLTTNDPGLRTFAQANQLENFIDESEDEDGKGRYTFNSPAREICGALTKLTGARNGAEELLAVERYRVTSQDQVRAR